MWNQKLTELNWKIIQKEHFLFSNHYPILTICTWNSEIAFMDKWKSFSRKKSIVIQKFQKLHSVRIQLFSWSRFWEHSHEIAVFYCVFLRTNFVKSIHRMFPRLRVKLWNFAQSNLPIINSWMLGSKMKARVSR